MPHKMTFRLLYTLFMKQKVVKKINLQSEIKPANLRSIDPDLAAARAIRVASPKAAVVNRLLRKTFS